MEILKVAEVLKDSETEMGKDVERRRCAKTLGFKKAERWKDSETEM